MVYNNTVYKPTSLSERLQAKFGNRGVGAVVGNGSSSQNANGAGEVISFFGRMDDRATANRAMPSKRRAPAARPAQSAARSEARPAERRPNTGRRAPEKRATLVNVERPVSFRVSGTFSRAYLAGDNVKRRVCDPSTRAAAIANRQKKVKTKVKGSRPAMLVTADAEKKEKKNIFSFIGNIFADRHVAEHRVKRSPFPFAMLTLIVICGVMLMTMLYTYAQVNEYDSKIDKLYSMQTELDAAAEKLEVKLEERDDIREIERIAVEEIGMVSSDMVQTKFVSVSADDRVEVLRAEEAEGEEGFSALLSVMGESFGRIGEYFN